MILFLWDSSNCPLKPTRGMLMVIQTEARSEETHIQKFTWIFRLVRAWTFNCKHVCNYRHQNHLSNWVILHYLEKLKCIIINPKNHIFLILGEIHICIQGSDTGSIIPKLKLCSRSHLAFYRELFQIVKQITAYYLPGLSVTHKWLEEKKNQTRQRARRVHSIV